MEVCKFDYTMLFLVVALMVLKPTWNDTVLLSLMGLVLLLAGILFLRGPRRPVAATA
jgi:hypothetical protein